MKKVIFIILLLMFAENQFGQNLRFGAKVGSHTIFTTQMNKENTDSYLPISSIKVIGELDLRYGTSFSLQPGWTFPTDEYSGVEVDLKLKKYFFDKSLFVDVGICFHNNIGKHSNSSHISEKQIILYNLDFGYFFSKRTFFEINYSVPSEKNIGYDKLLNEKFIKELNHIIAISFGILFN